MGFYKGFLQGFFGSCFGLSGLGFSTVSSAVSMGFTGSLEPIKIINQAHMIHMVAVQNKRSPHCHAGVFLFLVGIYSRISNGPSFKVPSEQLPV